MIIKALESLATSYTDDTLTSLLEKYNAIIEKEGGQKVFWDFGVTKENKEVQVANKTLEDAIKEKYYVSFTYHNAEGKESYQVVEPLAIHYKWYAWYLFAYSEKKEAYRTYKVARMQNINIEHRRSNRVHEDIKRLMEHSEKEYYKTCESIEIHFDKQEIPLMKEYFPDCKIERLSDVEYALFLHVPKIERLWKALLLSFGNKVRIVGPKEYKEELIQTAKAFLEKNDSI